MTKVADDLEAVRTVAETLEPFDKDSRERIIRWAKEKLGMQFESHTPAPFRADHTASQTPLPPPGPQNTTDIKTFVTQKNPKGDGQFAATVAYYHQFIAPEKKTSISKEDIVDACRKVVRKQPAAPAQVLVNAYNDGLFDRAGTGAYTLNSVGENLVTMTLPKGEGKTTKQKPAKPQTKKRVVKKGTRKKR